MVIGVRSSWPASSRKRRWAATPDSTRSSIALTERPRSASSSPGPSATSMRPDRSVSVMLCAVAATSRTGRRIRPATTQAPPAAASEVSPPTSSISRAVESAASRSRSAKNAATTTPDSGEPGNETGTAT